MNNPVTQDLSLLQRALLNMIAGPESAGRYDVRYTPKGGARFQLNGAHPRIYEPGPAGPSSAAGRYQFTWQTWRDLMGANTPFTPANQDAGALRLAQQRYKAATGRDIFADLQARRLQPVLQALDPTWAGFKDDPQKAIKAFYNTIGGKAPAGPASPPAGAAGAPSAASGAPAPISPEAMGLAGMFGRQTAPLDPLAMAAGDALAMGSGVAQARAARDEEDRKRRAALLSVDPLGGGVASLYG